MKEALGGGIEQEGGDWDVQELDPMRCNNRR